MGGMGKIALKGNFEGI